MNFESIIESLRYADNKLVMIDQTKLPAKLEYVSTDDYRVVVDSIKRLVIRGAPGIGIAGAYAVALVVIESLTLTSEKRQEFISHALREISSARPTAVNLSWAVERLRAVIESHPGEITLELAEKLKTEADSILREDKDMCRRIGEFGADLAPANPAILTHCNTGALATGGIGTALGVIYTLQVRGKSPKVYAGETRPLLQGSRLTVWELARAGVDVTLLVDGAAGALISSGMVNMVIVGADRIARNGDTANKIGTYPLAVVCKEHDISFYVAAPSTTFDDSIESGEEMPIEERSAEEVVQVMGASLAPPETKVFSPAFDITPGELITAFITDQGVHKRP
ncbi:MAG: S-methyl-5-thioribose-1-phosphate isomerase [candidate division Zixibacteria bacterium]|nr:S-methyl-5-thioribose-1-phosphate isomerase [candidate division Zixibacteria bacterium]